MLKVVFGTAPAFAPLAAKRLFVGWVLEAGWGTTVPFGPAAWTIYLNEWQERRRRYSRLVEEGVSPLAVSAEAAALMEENQLVKEAERRNLLTLLIDFVPADTYGQLLKDVG